MKRVEVSDLHHDTLVKISKKYKMTPRQMMEELIEENYPVKVRR